MKTLSIACLTNNNLILVTDAQDVKPLKDYLGEIASDYDSFFVEVKDGEYSEVWGFCGTVPYLSKLTTKII